jgi:hypothetical protein
MVRATHSRRACTALRSVDVDQDILCRTLTDRRVIRCGSEEDGHVRRSRCARSRYLIALALAFVCFGAGATAQGALPEVPENSALYWSGPIAVNAGTSPTGALDAMSCPSSTLCVGLDRAGNVLSTTDPAADDDWALTHLEGVGEGSDLSCTSAPLCVAVTGPGSIATSTDPTGGAGVWKTVTGIDGGSLIHSVSCVSGPLCLAVDEHGDLLSSTEPTGGAGTWTVVNVDGGHSLDAVSCVSRTLCFADDGRGDVLSSTEPAGGASAWSASDVAGGASLDELSCVPGLCVVGDEGGVLASTDPTGGAGTWVNAAGVEDGDMSCASTSLCVAIPAATNAGPWISTDPAGGSAAWVRSAGPEEGAFLDSVSCASRALCVIGDGAGNVAVGVETHILSVSSLLGPGLGSVTSTPIHCPFATCSHAVPGIIQPQPLSEIACDDIFGLSHGPGGTCSLGYPAGSEVTLTATPSPGSVFAGWGGACSGSTSCNLTIGADQAVSATFVITPKPAESVTVAVAPTLTDAAQTHTRWREGGMLAHISSAQKGNMSNKLPVGTTFSFTLNEPATVTFTFAKSASGRKLGKTCVMHIKRNEIRKKQTRRCDRLFTADTLTLSAHAGANRLSFDGVITKHKKLAPGDYKLQLIASASGKRSAPSKLHFTITNG